MSLNLAATDIGMSDTQLLEELDVWRLAHKQGLADIMELSEARLALGLASRHWQRLRERARQQGTYDDSQLDPRLR